MRIQSSNETKVQKEMHTLKKQLLQERNLKLDAFQKVDELTTHVYDLEDELTNIVQLPQRPQTSKPDQSRSKPQIYFLCLLFHFIQADVLMCFSDAFVHVGIDNQIAFALSTFEFSGTKSIRKNNKNRNVGFFKGSTCCAGHQFLEYFKGKNQCLRQLQQ
jgi:hypothetical protein